MKYEVETMRGKKTIQTEEEYNQFVKDWQVIGLKIWTGTKWKKVRLARSLYQ